MDFVQTTVEFQRARILVVEDDMTMKPIWMHIIDKVGQLNPAARSEVQWVTNVNAAQKILTDAETEHHGIDIVISDIFLSGSLTGLDLWRRESDTRDLHPGPRFLMTSVITPEKFETWIHDDGPLPIYLQKPLDIDACVSSLEAVWPQTRSGF